MDTENSEMHDGTLTVCLVDDDPMIRALFSRVVKRAGCRVLQAAGRSEAEKLLAENQIQLVVSDLMMPDAVDGENLLDTVLRKYPSVPVCIMSANWNTEARNKLLSDGASACIEKPFTAGFFGELVEKLVRSKPSNQNE